MKKVSKQQTGVGFIPILVAIVITGAISAVGYVVYKNSQKDSASSTTQNTDSIDSFAECAAAGNPIMESFPEQCAAGGKTFVKDVNDTTNEEIVSAKDTLTIEQWGIKLSVAGLSTVHAAYAITSNFEAAVERLKLGSSALAQGDIICEANPNPDIYPVSLYRSKDKTAVAKFSMFDASLIKEAEGYYYSLQPSTGIGGCEFKNDSVAAEFHKLNTFFGQNWASVQIIKL